MFSHWFCLRASCHKHAYVDQTLVTLTNFELPRNFWFWMHFYKYCRCHTCPRKCVSICFFIVYFAMNFLSQTTHIWIGVPYSLPEVCIFICLLKSNLLRTSCHKPRRYIVCFDPQDTFASECLFSKYCWCLPVFGSIFLYVFHNRLLVTNHAYIDWCPIFVARSGHFHMSSHSGHYWEHLVTNHANVSYVLNL